MLSDVEPFLFRDENFFVKRDDTIDPMLSGNKYRKLYTLIQTSPETFKTIISYGGTQSNAMLSIAALCEHKGWKFHYYSKPVPAHLKQQVSGNLKTALKLGMLLHEIPLDAYKETITKLKKQTDALTLVLPQGGADPIAQQGISVLAEEIKAWYAGNQDEPLNIITPSGTGTTAYYLALAIPCSNVLTTPSVGDNEYLKAQILKLGELPNNLRILESVKKYHFAKPYPEFLSMYNELKEAGIEFDLIYGAKMWLVLMQYMQNLKGTVLYVHSGGLMGNQTMLDRYHHKGIKT